MAYNNLSVPLFVSGYLAVMKQEKDSIKPLMFMLTTYKSTWLIQSSMAGRQ